MVPQRCFFFGVSYGQHAIWDHFHALGQELVRRGHRVVFLVNHQQQQITDHFGNPRIYTWPSPRPTRLRDAIFLRRLIKQYRPDCMIPTFGAVNLFVLQGRMHRVPVRAAWYLTMTAAIDLDNQTKRWRNYFRRLRRCWIYTSATHLIPNSIAVSDDLRQNYRVPQSKIWMQYLTLPDPLSGEQEVVPTSQRTHPVCVGRLEKTKGQDVLIRAIAELAMDFPDFAVDFLGDGPAETEFRHLAADLGVADRCHFLGRVPHADVLHRLAHAMFAIVPSRSEAFGLVNVEALAVGTPAIASDTGGIGEIVQKDVDGILVPPDNPTELAEAIRRYLSDEHLRDKFGSNSRISFSRFNQKTAIKSQADWFEQLVDTEECNR